MRVNNTFIRLCKVVSECLIAKEKIALVLIRFVSLKEIDETK